MVALKTNLRQESFLSLSFYWLRMIITTGLSWVLNTVRKGGFPLSCEFYEHVRK